MSQVKNSQHEILERISLLKIKAENAQKNHSILTKIITYFFKNNNKK